MTVAGTTTSAATNVTVNTLGALLYADYTFARTNVSLANGSNSFTAIALDSYGRTDTNTVSAWLPVAAPMKYDLNGNLTNDSRRVFLYDDENQLTTLIVTNASGAVTRSEFVYDGKMRRRIRKEYTLVSGAWNPLSEIRYVYDGMLVVQERHFAPQLSTNSPQQLVTYTRGRDLSGTLEGAGGIGGLLARSEISYLQSPHALYHADGNGNVTCLIGTNSVVLARYLYDPYGNLLSQSGSLADANLYRFSSKEWHVASGLVYYGYRFYAPELQRWPNRDPMGEPGFEVLRGGDPDVFGDGPNLYGLVRNNPASHFDSFGLQDGQTDTDRCKQRCHEWIDALIKSGGGGFNLTKALENCLEGCDRDPKHVPGSPIPPLPTPRLVKPPKQPLWPIIKECAKAAWDWWKDRKKAD